MRGKEIFQLTLILGHKIMNNHHQAFNLTDTIWQNQNILQVQVSSKISCWIRHRLESFNKKKKE